MTEGSPPKQDGIVVFQVRRETSCGQCGEELGRGSLIMLHEKDALCLSCADLDHLVWLGAGDAALTRRARKHSRLSAVVVEWSRTRKRYERQASLVEEEALVRAEEECLADADLREARRRREATRREELDAQYVSRFGEHVRELYPGCPAEEATRIAEHACRKYSGRVGRSAAAKELDPEAIRLAVVAAIRHGHTAYDELLMDGLEREDARRAVGDEVRLVEEQWRNAP